MVFDKLAELGVETDGIVSKSSRPTTRKTRVIDFNQQVLRINKEIKKQITPATLEKLTATIEKRILV